MSRPRSLMMRLLRMALPAVSCAVALAPAKEARAHDIRKDLLSVMHLNIAGGVRHGGRTGIADKLADSVAARRPGLPLAVSVNEVCLQQWSRLYDRLTPLGYTGHFGPSDWNTGLCKGQPFGNAIFWIGGHAEAQTFWIPDENQFDGAATDEKRNMVCGRAHFPPNTWYCSTHLLANDNGENWGRLVVTRRQADNIRAIANLLNASHRAIVMGDFNLQPTDPAMLRWKNGFWLDADSTWQRATHNDGKIDYVMARVDRFEFGHEAYITANVDSDHALVQGYPFFK